MKFTCATCGEEHDLGEMSFGFECPLQWDVLPASDRETSELTADQCIIRARSETHYFVRACLEIPLIGADQLFGWGVWVSLSERSFTEMADNWDNPQRDKLGPYFGWLCTRIPGYPDTIFLRTMIHNRGVGLRPLAELEPTEHPLSQHQHNGMPFQEMQDMAVRLLHEQG
jgi:hypothetical protein